MPELDLDGRIEAWSGRGSWIRTNDLQYPKLPRYQAALYPDVPKEAMWLHAWAHASKARHFSVR
jgi:hypothetical protein